MNTVRRRIFSFALVMVIALAGILMFGAGRARAASILVTGTGDTIAADGLCTLREAVQSANNNASPNVDCANGSGADTITFSVTGTITLSGTYIFINSPMTITGPGAGSLTVSGNNASTVFSVNCCVVSISGLTISGGNAGVEGGGINNGGTLTVTNTTISSNTASFSGGGINNFGTLTVTNSTVSGNTVGLGVGGGIANIGTLTVTNSIISGNTAPSGVGGGIYNAFTLTVTNSIISGNTAPSGVGGGIANSGTLTVTNTTISGNTASDSGGGIDNVGTLTVTNSTVSGNSALVGGGIVSSGPLAVTGSLISGNTGGTAAGIYSDVSGSVSASCIESNSGAAYDVDRLAGSTTFDGNWWGVATGPNIGGETTNVAVGSFLSARPACGAALGGAGTADLCDDGRINCRAGDDYVVIYNARDDHGHPALHFYCLTVDGVGRLGLDVDTHDLDDFPAHPASNTRVVSANSALCRAPVQFWILTTGEYQIVIGPDHKGDLIRIIFNGLPPSGIYVRRCNVLTSFNQCNAQ